MTQKIYKLMDEIVNLSELLDVITGTIEIPNISEHISETIDVLEEDYMKETFSLVLENLIILEGIITAKCYNTEKYTLANTTIENNRNLINIMASDIKYHHIKNTITKCISLDYNEINKYACFNIKYANDIYDSESFFIEINLFINKELYKEQEVMRNDNKQLQQNVKPIYSSTGRD